MQWVTDAGVGKEDEFHQGEGMRKVENATSCLETQMIKQVLFQERAPCKFLWSCVWVGKSKGADGKGRGGGERTSLRQRDEGESEEL